MIFEHNFWYHILAGMHDLINSLVSQAPQHEPIGLSTLAGNIFLYGGAILQFLIGSFFHLQVFALTIGLMLLLETARATIAVYRWIIGFIPLP